MSGAGQAINMEKVGFLKAKADHGRGKKIDSVSMDHVLLALHETKDERNLRIRSLSDFFDAANDGYLVYAHIESGLSALQILPEYKYAKELFKVCDADTDGRIDYHDFRCYMDDKELKLIEQDS